MLRRLSSQQRFIPATSTVVLTFDGAYGETDTAQPAYLNRTGYWIHRCASVLSRGTGHRYLKRGTP